MKPNFNITYPYNPNADLGWADPNVTIETINYDALSIWEKLTNPPKYKKAN